MSQIYRVVCATPEFLKATRALSLKHALAVWRLDLIGYQPVYKNRYGNYHILGRTLAYAAMHEEGFEWDEEYQDWFMVPFHGPF